MIHPSDEEPAKTLPNGWVMLEPGDVIPTDRMFCSRGDDCWVLTASPVTPSGLEYEPPRHRSLARRVKAEEREW